MPVTKKLYTTIQIKKKGDKKNWLRLSSVLLPLLILVPVITSIVFANSTWTQTNWIGGISSDLVTGTVTTYESATSINDSVAGQISIAPTAGWSNSYTTWSNRVPVTVTNAVASTLTNYQTRLTINYDSNMQADFDDIRFANSSGTELSYWIEQKVDSSTSTVWVKVDSLAASTTTTIYMYYGNSGAVSASNGVNTFILFDDFSGGSIDTGKWTTNDPSVFSVVAGRLRVQSSVSASWTHALYSSTAYARANIVFEGKYIWTNPNASYDAIMFGWHDNGSGISYADLVYAYYNAGAGTCTVSCPSAVYEDGSQRSPVVGPWTLDQQYSFRLRMKAAGGNFYEQSIDNQNWTTAYNSSYSTETNLRPSIVAYSGGTHFFDDLRVRQWSTTEPTGVIGAEESVYSTGVLTSNIFDTGYPSDWELLTFSGTGTIGVKVRTGNASDLSDASSWNSCSDISSGAELTPNECVQDEDRYVQYRVTLTPLEATTPVFNDIGIGYSPSDQVNPITNASAVGITGSSDGDWINNEAEITWTEGADNVGGTGILGYCVSLDEGDLGSSSLLNPEITAGVLQGLDDGIAESFCPFIASGDSLDLSAVPGLTLTTNKQYYLSLKAVDLSGNIWSGSNEDYQDLVSFRFDSTAPSSPGFISMPSNFISTENVTITWPFGGNPGTASDNESGLAGLQYRIGESGTWYGDLHTASEDNTDVLTNDGSYVTDATYDYPVLVEGINYIYFRSIDNAGNVSSGSVNGVLKINTIAPSQVLNLAATPSINTTNAYSFEWEPPVTFTGNISNIVYCYTINTIPSVNTCNFTDSGITELEADAFATQPGSNTIYIVAKDEANNINYDAYASTTFTYNGSAPGIISGLDIADISVKSLSNWKLALSWGQPMDIGAGVSKYAVYRSSSDVTCSSDFNLFTKVAEVNSTSYVDSGLAEQDYYYCVRACDSANNCSAVSTTVTEFPTGKFIEPALLLSEPEVTATTTRKAVINWTTDRTSDSRVQYGVTSNTYFVEEVSISNQTTGHTITLNNLEPGKTYFYKAKWTDEDGNIGISTEKSFTTDPAPVLKKVVAERVSVDNALIRFTTLDATQSKLFYGKNGVFTSLSEINVSQLESSYTLQLSALDDNSEYVYKINLVDIEGYEYEGDVYTFQTLPRPRVENVTIEEVKNSAQPTVEVAWDSNTEITSIVTFYPVTSPQLTQDEIDILPTKEHKMKVTGLLPTTQYGMVIRGTDALGNEAVSTEFFFTTATDTRPPTITNLKVETTLTSSQEDNNAQIIVSWETDELASSQVEYGEGLAGGLAQTTSIDRSLKRNHTVIISNVSPAKVYTVRAVARDENDNITTSSENVVITPKRSDSALDIVIKNLTGIFNFL